MLPTLSFRHETSILFMATPERLGITGDIIERKCHPSFPYYILHCMIISDTAIIMHYFVGCEVIAAI